MTTAEMLDQLGRVEIKAPVSGVIHELAVHTLNGFVGAGDTVLKIVPQDDVLVVAAQVDPTDVDQVRHGQRARLRFSAFQQETTPEIWGTVSRVPADVTTDQRRGIAYYDVEIVPDPDGLEALGDAALVAGMPVEAYLATGERTPLSYLLKPLDDQLRRAFRGG